MRTPRPVIVVVDPAPIVIWRPTPGLITDPGPSIRRAPAPLTIAIRRPVVIVVDNRYIGSPDPTVVIGIGPIAVGIKIFRAPDVRFVVAHVLVILKTRRQIPFPIVDPIVPVVSSRRVSSLPVTRFVAFVIQRGAVTVAHGKAGCVGINSRAAALAYDQVNSTLSRSFQAIDSFTFRRDGGFRRIDLEVLVVFIKARQAQRRLAFRKTERNAFISQRDDFDY